MKSYFTILIGTFVGLFIAMWVVFLVFFGKMAAGEYQIANAHVQLIARCNVGDIDILGDSTVNAAFIPSLIGSQVRDFGFGGGTPVELYYVAKSIMRCPDKPKAVILAFIPSSFATNPVYPQLGITFFWERAVEYGVVNFSDALEVLKYSRQLNDTLIAGPRSILDIDYRVKAFLISVKFPSYLFPEIQKSAFPKIHILADSALQRIFDRKHKHQIQAPTSGATATGPTSQAGAVATSSMLYNQTIADNGHHFYGTDSNGGDSEFDHDAFRKDVRIAPLAALYMRRTIAMLSANGIKVFLVEPPRDQPSAAHFMPGLIDTYQQYLSSLQSSDPYVHLIGEGFPIWDTILFGDNVHLNLRGSLIFSGSTRQALAATGQVDPGSLQVPTIANLYAETSPATTFWKAPSSVSDEVRRADEVVVPQLAYPVNTPAWLYSTRQDTSGATRRPGLTAPPVGLIAKTNYATSVLVKNINADEVSLQLSWPGGIVGTVSWNFSHRQIGYTGGVDKLNGGVTICPDGWVELFISGPAGKTTGPYAGPTIAFSAAHGASAYLYDMNLERGLWPTNYCPLQPGEAKTIPLPQKAS